MVTATAGSSVSCPQLLRQAEHLKSKIHGKSSAATTYFSEEFIARQDLQKIYKVLLLTDLQYALEKKVELELWNNIFKIHIDRLRQDLKDRKGNEKAELQARISVLIDSSTGFYFELLQELCASNNLHLQCHASSGNFCLSTDIKVHNTDRPKASLCLYACQDCLVHLGDLARYRNDWYQAESFYFLAASLLPGNGQPYNQLAILSTAKGNNLEAIFYYCKSILVHNQFPAAASNLHKTFSQACARQNLSVLAKTTCLSYEEFISLFIQFHGSLYLMQDIGKLPFLKEQILTNITDMLNDFCTKDIICVVAINIFSLHKYKPREEVGGRECLTEDEIEVWHLALSLAMALFQEMVETVFRSIQMTSADAPLQCKALIGVKMLIDWLACCSVCFLKSEVLPGFKGVFEQLLVLAAELAPRRSWRDSSGVSLPEDLQLQGYLPFRKVHRKLDFRTSVYDLEENDTSLRIARICAFAEALSQQEEFKRLSQRVTLRKPEQGEPLADVAGSDTDAPLGHDVENLCNKEKYNGPSPPKMLGSVGDSKEISTSVHGRSKSPFAETRSLFRTDSEEQGMKTLPEMPHMMTSYSLFQSGWDLQLKKEQLKNDILQEVAEGSSADDFFPDTVAPRDVFPTSQSDAQPLQNDSMVQREASNGPPRFSASDNWMGSPSKVTVSQAKGDDIQQYQLLPTASPPASELHTSLLPGALHGLAGARPQSASVSSFALGSSTCIGGGQVQSLPLPSSPMNSFVSSQDTPMYSHSSSNYGMTGQGWASTLVANAAIITSQQSPVGNIATESSIWGDGLFANGHQTVQSIWSPGMGTNVMSPLQQLLQEQKRHQRPK